MVAVTYDVARVPTGEAVPQAARAARAAPSKRWYVRFMEALIEARTEQARREVARHIHLLPYNLDERGDRLVKTDSRNMPFGGW